MRGGGEDVVATKSEFPRGKHNSAKKRKGRKRGRKRESECPIGKITMNGQI